MRGYILIENKIEVIPGGNIYTKLEDLLDAYYSDKDEAWDCENRNTFTWIIVNLRNGKTVKLRSWKTAYPGHFKIDMEQNNPHEYTTKQIKRIKDRLR